MQHYEVVIVGAGPAGATCARILSHWGLSVLVMDRDRFPRDKPCAGWITPAVLDALRIDPQRYRQGRLLQEIREFRTGIMFGRELRTDFGTTVSYAIRRSEFDQFLLDANTGPAQLGQSVQSLERTGDGWLINGEIRARLLVGAGGHQCPVARALGARPAGEPAVLAQVVEFAMGEEQQACCRLAPGHTALSFTRDGRGYGWILRKGRYLNIGLGCRAGREISKRMNDFCVFLRRRGDFSGDLGGPSRGAAYLTYRERGGRRLVGDRALLIGDAAGLAYPESGEGILPAVESAIMAAQTILCASGDYRPRWLEPYAALVADRFGRDLGWAGKLCVPPRLKRLGARLMLSNPWLTRRLVLDSWFLHRDQRPLVPRSVPEDTSPDAGAALPVSG
jgi:menaquinone-9 beta-reductase